MSTTSESKKGVFSDLYELSNNEKEAKGLVRAELRVLLHDFFPSVNQV